MVEVIANLMDHTHLDELSFKLGKTASYITNRRSCTYHPQGSNIYSSNVGVKLIKMHINGTHWTDPPKLRIMFETVNTDITARQRLRPIGGPWAFFSRMRVLAGGQILEDMMLNILTTEGSRYNDYAEGFGNV